MEIPINNICYSRANGPGYRLVVWIQGCKFNCKGCFNPSMHPYTKNNMQSIVKLAERINNDFHIDGVTFSGGEPLDYPQQMRALLKMVDGRLTRIIYSGYRLDEILKKEELLKVVKMADLSIVGRYDFTLSHPYLGKKFILTSRRIDMDYFKPRFLVEYILNKNIVIKSGIFKSNIK